MSEDGKAMVIFQPSGCRGYIDKGKTIKEASVALGVDMEGVCGEMAVCGTCKVRIEEGDFEKYDIKSSREHVAPIRFSERKFFNLQQEEAGFRLACQTEILGDIVVFVPEESRMGKQIVRKEATDRPMKVNPAVKKYCVDLPKPSLQDSLGDLERIKNALNEVFQLTDLTIDSQVLLNLQNSVRDGDWKLTVSVWKGREIIKVEPGLEDKAYGLAVDVGTSTVAGYLCDLTDGKVVATAAMMNPQVVYGEDVMSRISYTMTNPNGLAVLNKAIIDGLNGIVEDVADQTGIKRQDIVDMAIVGNTCMHHIYLNIDPRYIGRAPFNPALHHSLDIKARDWGLNILPEPERSDKGGYPPCQVECPAGVNGQDFIYLTAQGRFQEALEMVRLAMPFAGVCGRVCNHPCEKGCERGEVEAPLSIQALHRFIGDHELKAGREKASPMEKMKEDRVAVIGSGPSGLACAYDLIRKGFPITVFEAAPESGGMLRYGIPGYRLSNTVLDNEIALIQELGVEIKTNTAIERLEDLFEQGFKAVFIASGAWKSQELGIPGAESGGVVYALDFLNKVNGGEKPALGDRIAVIGGGSVAIDAARSALRLGAQEVHLISLESRDLTCSDRMLAQDQEIVEAEEEGVIFHPSLGVTRILTEAGKIAGLETETCVSVFDSEGAFAPKFAEGPTPIIETDTVIIAIGQKADGTAFPELDKSPTGTITVDKQTLETNVKGVFAGGDVVSGPADVIGAIAFGKEAAISIELFVEDKDLSNARPAPFRKVEDVPKEGVTAVERKVMPVLEPEKRKGFSEVELGFDAEMSTEESKRCLNCGIYAQKEGSDTGQIRDVGIKISPGAYIHVLPIEAGFVGADNVGVLIAEEPYNQDSTVLIIDIGTNGELILGNRERLISSSCATGPAFEGAEIKHGMRAAPGAIETIEIDRDTKEPRFKVIGRDVWNTELEEFGARGICGSGIIDGVAQLYLAEIIDKTGRFKRDLSIPRLRESDGKFEFVIAWANETAIGQDIVICQDDIRAIQLGKAAMYTGDKIMMRTLGVEKVDKVILAGAFGSHINKDSAAILGFFPDCDPENIYSVGNAAGDGARMALLDVDKRSEADEFARKVKYTELTVAKGFQKEFLSAIAIPHKTDEFPNLERIVPPETLHQK